jgi:hypothetical protein
VAYESTGQDGLTGGDAGAEHKFTIQLQDQFRNNITALNGPKVEVESKILGPSPAESSYQCSDGKCVVTYRIYKVGQYALDVSINNVTIENPNFSIAINAAATNGSNSYTVGADQDGVAGVPINCTLQLVDTYGNNVTNPTTNPTIVAALTGPQPVTAKITNLGQGLYVLSYTAAVAGEYQFSIKVNSLSTVGSPFFPTIMPANSSYPSNCVAYGPNLNSTVAGSESVIYVLSKDYFGNNRTSPDDPSLQWNLQFFKGNQPVNGSFFAQWNNTLRVYQVNYNVTLAADLSMRLFINNMTIRNDQIGLRVIPGKTYGPNCVAVGGGLVDAITDQKEYFWVTSYDRWHNLQIRGGDNFTVALRDNVDGGYITAPLLEDLRNATYLGTYVIKKSGVYYLEVTLDGLAVNGSPFKVDCRWAGLPTYIVIIIGASAVLLVTFVCVALYLYQTKFKKRREYQALRDPTEPTVQQEN